MTDRRGGNRRRYRSARGLQGSQRVIEAAPIGICITGPDGAFEMVNPAYCRFFGYSPDELLGRPFTLVVPLDQREALADLHRRFIDGDIDHELRGEWEVRLKSGEIRTVLADAVRIEDEDGRPSKVTFVVDISERKQLEQRLEVINQRLSYLATYDDLTGLYNRRAGLDRLAEELHRGHRYDSPLCVAVFDLDHFKRVNDRYGHGVGDEVLREIGELTRARLRDTDIAVRLGGEEFLMIMPGVDIAGAVQAMERLRQTLAQTPLSSQALTVTLSAGIVGFEDQTLDTLLEQADSALYRAKEKGRNRLEVLDEVANDRED